MSAQVGLLCFRVANNDLGFIIATLPTIADFIKLGQQRFKLVVVKFLAAEIALNPLLNTRLTN